MYLFLAGGGGGGGGSGGGGGGGGGGSGGGGGRLMGPPMGGAGGAVPSNADIRAKLNAMFGGAPMPAAAPRVSTYPLPSLHVSPCSYD